MSSGSGELHELNKWELVGQPFGYSKYMELQGQGRGMLRRVKMAVTIIKESLMFIKYNRNVQTVEE